MARLNLKSPENTSQNSGQTQKNTNLPKNKRTPNTTM